MIFGAAQSGVGRVDASRLCSSGRLDHWIWRPWCSAVGRFGLWPARAAAGGMMAVVIGLLVSGRRAVSGRLYQAQCCAVVWRGAVADPRHLHRRAGGMASSVIARVRPYQFENATPCTEWDVRANDQSCGRRESPVRCHGHWGAWARAGERCARRQPAGQLPRLVWRACARLLIVRDSSRRFSRRRWERDRANCWSRCGSPS